MATTTQLNQIIAVEKGVKARAAAAFTEAVQQVNKADLLAGITRTYQPKDEDGDRFPPESKRVQVRTHDVLFNLRNSLVRLFDITATKDTTNGTAKADIVVDGTTRAKDVPATTLIFLEKCLADLLTFVNRLPVLDPAETWHYDDTADAYATEQTKTAKSKKVPRNHVRAEATDRHPAQVDLWHEDVVVGYWSTVKFSGALPQKDVTAMAGRVVKLAEAVKVAREKANTVPVVDARIGAALFDYLLA